MYAIVLHKSRKISRMSIETCTMSITYTLKLSTKAKIKLYCLHHYSFNTKHGFLPSLLQYSH